MNDSSRGLLHTKPEDPHVAHSRSMHIPASSAGAMPESRQGDHPGTYPSQLLSLRKDDQGAAVPVESGNDSFGLSQSSEGSKHSPNVLGSESQTSQTTSEGTQPSSYSNGQGLSQPSPSNGTKADGQSIGVKSPGPVGQTDVSSVSRSAAGSRPRVGSVSGQKRTAAGDIKTLPDGIHTHEPGLNTGRGHRSKSIGSPSRENKIAELSAYLRSRLSYAAAKVEKDWQRDDLQVPFRLRQNTSPTPTASTTKPTSPASRWLQNGTPENTLASAPSASEASRFYPSNGSARMSPAARPDNLLPDRTSRQPLAAGSPTKSLQPSKLAPPVDIISSGSGRRRRPNPNESGHSRYTPYPGHRRYHSQQEFGTSKLPASSDMTLAPETPPLRPSIHTASPATHGHSRARTQSQSTLMEQDAIETLLFMSSPENSGYRPSSLQPQNTAPKNIAPATSRPSAAGNRNQQRHMNGENGRSGSGFTGQCSGIEARAGDEIDRLLDQMEDSDSDDGWTPSNRVDAGSQSASSRPHSGTWRGLGI